MVFSRTEHTPLLDGDGAPRPPDYAASHAVAGVAATGGACSSSAALAAIRAQAGHGRDHLSHHPLGEAAYDELPRRPRGGQTIRSPPSGCAP